MIQRFFNLYTGTAFIPLILLSFLMVNSPLAFEANISESLVPTTLFKYVYSKPTESIKIVERRVDPKQLKCLADNIYHEAGHESVRGQAAVARVVVNRVNHGFARTPCQVVYQSISVRNTETDELRRVCQFSWTCQEGIKAPSANSARYQQAERIAYDVLVKDAYRDVVSGGTLFFHSVSIAPDWTYRQVQKIGNHIFYTRGNQKG